MDKVSVIIPLYNSERTIEKTIESVLNQTWPNIEAVIIDDGSTDHSFQVASQFESEQVKIFRQENKGACAARNHGFKVSTGDYIQYLDADDFLASDKIEKQLLAIRRLGDLNSVASGKWVEFYHETDIRENALTIYRDYENPIELLTDMWARREMMSQSVWLVPSQTIERAGGWDETLQVNQDGEFFSRVLLNSQSVIFTDTVTYYRKGNTSSVSNSRFKPEKVDSLLESFLLYERHVDSFKHKSEVKRALANNYYYFIYTYYHLFPKLVNTAIERVNDLGMKPIWELSGAENFKRISRVMGYYNTLRLRKFLYRLGAIQGGVKKK